eukprot:g31175.t1
MYPVRRYGDDLGREKTKIIDPRLAERERVLVEREKAVKKGTRCWAAGAQRHIYQCMKPRSTSLPALAGPSAASRCAASSASKMGEEVGESLRRSQHTTPSSVWSPCRTAWGEAPTFGSPTVELQPETPEGARPGSSLRRTGTRIFCRPVRSEVRVDETRRGRGRTWHCSEISEDEVIFCFAPTESGPRFGG